MLAGADISTWTRAVLGEVTLFALKFDVDNEGERRVMFGRDALSVDRGDASMSENSSLFGNVLRPVVDV